MAVSDEISTRRNAVSERLETLQQYRGNETYLAVIQLLKAIEDAYADDLREVSMENLKLKQGGCKQCFMLRQALIDGGKAPPKL